MSGQGTLTINGGGNITLSGDSNNDGTGDVRVMAVDSNATLTLQNLTIVNGNAGAFSGGGINNFGTATITNSTFSGNSAGGSGINNAGTATLKNTIIANSTGGGDCVTSVALSGSNNNNLIEDTGANACNLTNGVNGNVIGSDPNLGTLTGSPAYFPLNPGSPAIDAGNNTTCAAAPVNNQSQNGVTRPQNGNGDSSAVCDIGSYELPDTTTPALQSFTRFNEPLLAGVTVDVRDGSGNVLARTTTGSDGVYRFAVPGGGRMVYATTPAGYEAVTPVGVSLPMHARVDFGFRRVERVGSQGAQATASSAGGWPTSRCVTRRALHSPTSRRTR